MRRTLTKYRPTWRIWGPREIHEVLSAEALEALHLAKLTEKGLEPWDAGAGAVPRINWGRWLLDCAECRSGVVVSVEWDLGACFGCGGLYHGLTFPPNREALERALLARPRQYQSWEIRETLEDLLAENRAYNVVGVQ